MEEKLGNWVINWHLKYGNMGSAGKNKRFVAATAIRTLKHLRNIHKWFLTRN